LANLSPAPASQSLRYFHLIDNVILTNHSSRSCFYRRLLVLRAHRSLESSYSVLHNDLDVVSVGSQRVVGDEATPNAGGQLKITLTIP
jgi:hypothetical protein